jgi:hypothetical protein
VDLVEGLRRRDAFAAGFSLRETKRLMAAVPLDAAQAIGRMRAHVRYGTTDESPAVAGDQVQHPLIDGSVAQRAALLKVLAGCAPGTQFAQVCRTAAEQLVEFEKTTASGDNNVNNAFRKYAILIIGNIAQFVLQAWGAAGRIDTLAAQQENLSAGNPRARRVLKAARIPLWAVSTLSKVDTEDLRSMTAMELVRRAGLGQPHSTGFVWLGEPSQEILLADAEAALRLMRILATLRLEPTAWNAILEHVAFRLEAYEETCASRVEEVPVPPRPCHPPGGIVLSEPRVPRAPGGAAPRRRIDRDRCQLHRSGRRGGRLTV